MTTTPARQPKGRPTGGQFAGKCNPESEVELSSVPNFGSPYGQSPSYVLPDGREVTMWRKGQRVRFYDADGNQVGPEQKNVAPAAAYAYSQGWRNPEMPPEHDPPNSRRWARVGVMSPDAVAHLEDRGYSPTDYVSEDRDCRMAAHAAAGEVMFEGELLSNAYELHRHVAGLDKNRVFHHPTEVYFKGNPTRWSSMSATEQIAYIRGYAKAIANDGDQSKRPKVPWTDPEGDGYVRGTNAVHAAQMIDEGRAGDRGFRIVDPDAVGRVLVVTNARPTRRRDGYVAEVAAGQKRRHHTDTESQDVPWAEGTKMFFRADALGV